MHKFTVVVVWDNQIVRIEIILYHSRTLIISILIDVILKNEIKYKWTSIKPEQQSLITVTNKFVNKTYSDPPFFFFLNLIMRNTFLISPNIIKLLVLNFNWTSVIDQINSRIVCLVQRVFPSSTQGKTEYRSGFCWHFFCVFDDWPIRDPFEFVKFFRFYLQYVYNCECVREVWVCLRECVCVCMCECMCIYVRGRECVSTCVYMYVCIYIFIYMYVCMYLYIYKYIWV